MITKTVGIDCRSLDRAIWDENYTLLLRNNIPPWIDIEEVVYLPFLPETEARCPFKLGVLAIVNPRYMIPLGHVEQSILTQLDMF